MPLRIYMLRGLAQSGPTIGVTFYRYSWSTGGVPSPFLGSIDKNDETANGYAVVNCGVGSPGPINDTDNGLTVVYPLPQNTTLSGTVDLGIPAHADFRYQYDIVLHIWVTQGVSGLTRGTLLNGYVEPGGTNDLPPSSGPVKFVQLASPVAVTPVNGLAGDYIVFELGIIARGPAPNNGGVNYYHGVRASSGAILPDGVAGDTVDTTLASHAPWFEFAQVTSFPNPITTNCCAPGPGAPGPNPPDDPIVPGTTITCAGGGVGPSGSTPTDPIIWLM